MADNTLLYPAISAYPITPEQLAEAQATAEAWRRYQMPPPPVPQPMPVLQNDVLTDIGHGLARGVAVDIPEIAGRVLQTFGADETGRSIEQAAQTRGREPQYQTTGLLGSVASMVPAVGGIAATSLIPGVGQVGAGLLGGGIFGASQYTATREKGGTIPQALGAAAVQGVGQGVGAGIAGGFISGAAARLRQGSLAAAMEQFTNPSLLGDLSRSLIHAEATQLPLQAAVAASTAAIERGLPDTPTPWEAAKQSFAPTALLTAVMAPFGAPRTLATQRSRVAQAAVVQNPNLPAEDRLRAVQSIAAQLRTVDRTGADAWEKEAIAAINSGAVPEMHPDYEYRPEIQPGPSMPIPTKMLPGPDGGPYSRAYGGSNLGGSGLQGGPGGLQTPLDLLRQHAMQAAQEAAAAREAARTAEEARLEPFRRDQPPVGGIDVQDLGSMEHIDVRDVPEQIDVHAPETIPTYDVTQEGQVQKVEHIDIKTPEEYESTNKQGRATWLKSILGTNASDAVGKLAGVHFDELPTQVQKLWNEKGGEAAKAAYVPRLEELFTRLTGKNIREPFDATVKATAEDTTGAKPSTATDTTGAETARSLEQAVGDTGNAKPGVGAGEVATQDQVTAQHPSLDPRALLPEGQVRYGEASRQPPTQEELNAALTRQESESRVAERQGIGVERAAEGVDRQREGEVQGARAEDGGGNRVVEGGQVQGDAEAAATHAVAVAAAEQQHQAAQAAFQQVTPELQQARARLAELDAQTNELGQLREQYNRIAKLRDLSPEQQAARLELQRHIGELAVRQRASAAEHEELTQRISDLADAAKVLPEYTALTAATGRAEKAQQRGVQEEATDSAYYSFKQGLDPSIGVARGSNLRRVFNYLEAHKYAGMMKFVLHGVPEELRNIFKELMGSKDASKGFSADSMLAKNMKVKRAAAQALSSVTNAQHEQFLKYATHIAQTIRTAGEVNAAGKAEAEKIARALKEYYDLHYRFDYQNDRIAEMARTGTITAEDAASMAASIEHGREAAAAEAGYGGRGRSNRLAADAFGAREESVEELLNQLYTRAYSKFERSLAAADVEKTGLSRMDNEKLAARVAETPHAMGVLEHLGRTHHNPLIRLVAKLMAAAKPTATIEVVENPDFNGGRYIPRTDTIEIGRGGMNTTTMLHEVTHALSHAGILRALGNVLRTDLSPQEAKEVEALKTIQDVMARFAKTADLNNPEHVEALKDEHEFLSEALNNGNLQLLLGGRGNLWQRTLDAISKLVPGWERVPHTDFQRLMESSATLFGNPNRDISTVFRRSLNQMDTPWFMSNLVKGFFKLDAVDAAMTRASDVKEPLLQKGLAFVTLNHQKEMFRMAIDKAKLKFPSAASALDRLGAVHNEFRQNVADRAGIDVLVKTEGNKIATQAWALRRKHLQLSERTGKMGVEATRLGVDPSVPITPEDSPAARQLKNEYQSLKATSAQLQRRAGNTEVATPMSVYHGMVDFHDLMLTRETAQRMASTLQVFGAHELPELQPVMKQLDAKVQAGRYIGSTPVRAQRQALAVGMKEALRIAKEIHEREIATGGADSKGAADAGALRASLDDQYSLHELQRKVPYMHIGRAGKYMVMFTVKGGNTEWNQLAPIMAKLQRGWGPPHNENRRVYMKFENLTHYKEATELLRPFLDAGMFRDENNRSTWADGAIDEKLRSQDAATPGFMRAIQDHVRINDVINSDAKAEFLRVLHDTFLQQLPDTSPLKSSAARDGLAGYSTDYIRSFGDRATMSAQGLQRLRSVSLMSDTLNRFGNALRDLREDTSPGITDFKVQAGRYASDLRGRIEDLNRPVDSPFIDRLRAFPAAWRLALAPAYFTMLGMQPWQMTLPALGARYGYAGSAMTMAKNSALSFGIVGKLMKLGWLESGGDDAFSRVASLSNLNLEFAKLKKPDGSPLLNQAQLDLLHHVQWSSLLNFGATNQIARLDPLAKGPGAKVLQAVTVLPHMVEVSNRLIAALSAHELLMDKEHPDWRANNGGGPLVEGTPMNAAQTRAKEYALQVIRDTDGDHSQANVARGLGRRGFASAATPLIIGFQQFDIQATEMLYRNYLKLRGGSRAEQKEAAKVLAGVAGMTSLIAGTLGLPFMGLASGLANTIGSLFQDKDDTPFDLQHSIRQYTAHIVGNDKTEEVISRGLPRLLDIDMSTRSGFADLAPFTSFISDRRKLDDRIKDGAFEFLGPSIGAIAGIATGINAAHEGDYVKAINDGLPAFARNLGKAYRLANHGYETEGSNIPIPISAPTAWNIAAQALGFQSGKRAEQSETSFQYKTNQQLLERRQQVLRNEMYRAFDAGDYNRLGAVMQENIRFAVRHPQFSVNIESGLRQRLEERAVGAMTGTGILANKRALYPIMQQFPEHFSPQ